MSPIRTSCLSFCTPAILAAAAFLGRVPVVFAQDDVADVPAESLKADGDEKMQYFLIGKTDAERAPKSGFGLLVVLPGGDGSADFQPFVKRIYKNALPDGYLVAQPVAVKWKEDQQIVWPTEGTPVDDQEFTTEQFIESVISDVKENHKINDKRVYTLTWSSSGPAAYATALQKETAVCGSFIAMSVFKPKFLPDLEIARGRSFFILHSPDDRVCPFRMAEAARDQLKEAKAVVEFQRYDGGHGWRGDVYANIRKGIDWLESISKKKIKQEKKKAEAGEKEGKSPAPKPAGARKKP